MTDNNGRGEVREVSVALADGRGYTVAIGEGLLAEVGARLPATVAQVAVVSDATVWGLHGEAVMTALRGGGRRADEVIIGAGESAKTMATVGALMDAFTAMGLRRDGGVVALGGGVVGDVAGFAAAVYMRGVALAQVPTTLLAQVDAAIGGKTGVNHAAGKNLIGAFYQPQAVVCDVGVLATLPPREFCAGLAEVVKYGLLADAAFFGFLEANWAGVMRQERGLLTEVIFRSARIKAEIVAADERETDGRRALLNLGHTFAHAIEQAGGYGEWLHGEAVAAGLVAAARLSEELSGFSSAATARIVSLLQNFNLPITPPPAIAVESLLAAMNLDKKNTTAQKRFVLMERIGSARLQAVETPDGAAAVRRALAATAGDGDE